jgi:hypothetical protein
MTIAQFHHLEHQAELGHRRALPSGGTVRLRRRTPEPALIGPTAPVETPISSTTLESSCTTSR